MLRFIFNLLGEAGLNDDTAYRMGANNVIARSAKLTPNQLRFS